jgi:acetyl esterase/lipase
LLSVLILLLSTQLYSQEKESEFKQYTIETTYQKLKKNYDFISPIQALDSKEIKSRENVVYKKVGDRKLEADVYIPKGNSKKTYPAVLLIHGGGWLTGSKENQRVMAQHLALNGYVAVTASYRLGLEEPYPAAVVDLKDALRWMRINAKRYHINPDKIAVLGASAGAQLATLLGVTSNSSVYGFDNEISDEVQVIVNIDGIVSFIHPEASSEGKMASIWLGSTKEENLKNWKEASPLEYITENTPPTLFINSSQPRFHAGRDDMIQLLNRFGIDNETHTIKDTPHSFWLMHPWFEETLNYTISFLDKTLKN